MVNTNAMLYTADPLPTTPRDIEDLAGLQKIAGLAGTAIAGALTAASQLVHANLQPSPAPPPTSWVDMLAKQERAIDKITSAPALPANPWPAYAKKLKESAKKRAEAVAEEVASLKDALTSLKAVTSELEKEEDFVPSYLQTIEDGRSPRDWLKQGDPAPDFEAVDNGFIEVAHALDVLKERQDRCVTAYTDVHDAVELLLKQEAANANETQTKVSVIAAELGSQTTDDCPDQPGLPSELQTFQAIAADLAKPMVVGLNRDGLTATLLATDIYLTALDSRAQLEDKTAKVLEKRSDTGKLASEIETLVHRQQDRAVEATSRVCPGQGVVEVPPDVDVYRWDTVQSHGFKLAADSPFASGVVTHHAEIDEVRYELEPASGIRPKVSFGITHAFGLRDPTFELTDIKVGSEPAKYIVRTKEDTHVAVPVGMVSFLLFPSRLPKTVRAGDLAFDVGVGLASSSPAFFVGLSIKVPGARLGAGFSWQEVTALAKGLKEVKRLPDGTFDPQTLTGDYQATALSTRSGFPRRFYLSLTVPTSSLPFFGGGGQ
jgi:hypothetical protein